MWVSKLLISPVKKGFFAQKRPNVAQNWHFCPLLAHLVPCWWIGWWFWRAGCISQDTYLLYPFHVIIIVSIQDQQAPHQTRPTKLQRKPIESAPSKRPAEVTFVFLRCSIFPFDYSGGFTTIKCTTKFFQPPPLSFHISIS